MHMLTFDNDGNVLVFSEKDKGKKKGFFKKHWKKLLAAGVGAAGLAAAGYGLHKANQKFAANHGGKDLLDVYAPKLAEKRALRRQLASDTYDRNAKLDNMTAKGDDAYIVGYDAPSGKFVWSDGSTKSLPKNADASILEQAAKIKAGE